MFQALNTLQAAYELGVVILITNAETGWIQLSGRKYLPKVMDFIEVAQIRIISARSTWEPKGILSPFDWKGQSFCEEMYNHARFCVQITPPDSAPLSVAEVVAAAEVKQPTAGTVTPSTAAVDTEACTEVVVSAANSSSTEAVSSLATPCGDNNGNTVCLTTSIATAAAGEEKPSSSSLLAVGAPPTLTKSTTAPHDNSESDDGDSIPLEDSEESSQEAAAAMLPVVVSATESDEGFLTVDSLNSMNNQTLILLNKKGGEDEGRPISSSATTTRHAEAWVVTPKASAAAAAAAAVLALSPCNNKRGRSATSFGMGSDSDCDDDDEDNCESDPAAFAAAVEAIIETANSPRSAPLPLAVSAANPFGVSSDPISSESSNMLPLHATTSGASTSSLLSDASLVERMGRLGRSAASNNNGQANQLASAVSGAFSSSLCAATSSSATETASRCSTLPAAAPVSATTSSATSASPASLLVISRESFGDTYTDDLKDDESPLNHRKARAAKRFAGLTVRLQPSDATTGANSAACCNTATLTSTPAAADLEDTVPAGEFVCNTVDANIASLPLSETPTTTLVIDETSLPAESNCHSLSEACNNSGNDNDNDNSNEEDHLLRYEVKRRDTHRTLSTAAGDDDLPEDEVEEEDAEDDCVPPATPAATDLNVITTTTMLHPSEQPPHYRAPLCEFFSIGDSAPERLAIFLAHSMLLGQKDDSGRSFFASDALVVKSVKMAERPMLHHMVRQHEVLSSALAALAGIPSSLDVKVDVTDVTAPMSDAQLNELQVAYAQHCSVAACRGLPLPPPPPTTVVVDARAELSTMTPELIAQMDFVYRHAQEMYNGQQQQHNNGGCAFGVGYAIHNTAA